MGWVDIYLLTPTLSKRGRYLLTGSQNLLLIERVTESLAGRAAMLRT
jgi:hypothetical protein